MGGLAYGTSRVTATAAMPLVATGIMAGPRAARELEDATRVRLRPVIARHTPASIARHVREAAARHGLPESLVAAVISVESEGNPRAISRRGAVGLMQLMPSTAAGLGVRNVFDPGENVDGGARHLRHLIDRFSGDVTLALAAYNAGAQAVLKHKGVPPYPETRSFVARVLGRAGTITSPMGTAVTAPAASVARRPVEPSRSGKTESTVTPAVLADGRTAANAFPASEPSWSDVSDVSVTPPPPLPGQSEAP
jgi:hypothetical protein